MSPPDTTSPNPFELVRRPLQRALRTLIVGEPRPIAASGSDDRVDDGWFGPSSVTWVVHADATMLVGGLRALLMQSAHPLAMAGVAEHSDYRRDPLGRLNRTAQFVGITTYADTPQAEAAVKAVRKVHRRVKGVAPDGRPYSAGDPHLLAWVHLTEVDSFLAAYQRYGTLPLSADNADRYVAESRVVARRMGVKRPPGSVAELRDQIDRYADELAATPQSRAAVRFLAIPRALPIPARPTYGVLLAAAVALLSPELRSLHRLPLLPGSDTLAIGPAARVVVRALGWVLAPPPGVAVARANLELTQRVAG